MVVFHCFLASIVSNEMLVVITVLFFSVYTFLLWPLVRFFFLYLVLNCLPVTCLGVIIIWEILAMISSNVFLLFSHCLLWFYYFLFFFCSFNFSAEILCSHIKEQSSWKFWNIFSSNSSYKMQSCKVAAVKLFSAKCNISSNLELVFCCLFYPLDCGSHFLFLVY